MKVFCDCVALSSDETKQIIEQLTKEKIDDIHRRGKLTIFEKVEEWENIGLCAPGDGMGGAANRCYTFKNCHECLVDYASNSIEHEKIKYKAILPYGEKAN